jgi:hypothetical protein
LATKNKEYMKVKIEKAIKRFIITMCLMSFLIMKSSGLVLIGCTIFSLFMANSILANNICILVLNSGRRLGILD